jgi:hypothetical protein
MREQGARVQTLTDATPGQFTGEVGSSQAIAGLRLGSG